MLKTLLKKQMAEIFRNYFYDPKKNKMRSRGATIAYIVLYALLMVGLLGGIFALMAVGLCGPLVEGGMDWLYYLLVGLIAVFLGTFGSVFSTYSSLYLSKDNDLLLSLPIPVRCVMASRLLGVYLLGLMYAAVVIVPGVIVYWLTAPVTAGTIVGGVLMVLIVSVIVMVLSCLLGWVVARISLKLKNKSFITVLLSLLFLAAYYFVYYKAQALITLLVENAAVYGMKIRGSAYLLYLFGSVGAGDWLAMGIVTVTQAALLALTLWGIARSFLKIATATGSVKKVRFEHRAVRAQSVQRALFGKELRRFTASPNYMLNCGLGILMLPVAGIVLLIKGGALGRMLADVFSGNVGVVPVLMCAAVCLLASMNDMAAPAVSLEGRNLWLVQSLPVVPWQALRAKLDVQLVLTGVPVLFCALCMVIVLPGSALEKALLVIVALLLYPAERAGRARARAQDAEPDVDQRDHAHQAERLRDALALCQLVLCPRAWRAVLPVRQCAECSGVSGHLRRRDGGGQRAAAPLGETAGRAHLCRALKEKRKPPRSNLDRGGFLLRNALTA